MKHFSLNLIVRIALIGVLSVLSYIFFTKEEYPLLILSAGSLLIAAASLYRFCVSVNNKLIFFFESVQYSDFTVRFGADNKLGRSFRELNRQMNAVMEAFKAARAEKEANLHYLNTLVQHVEVGILCYDASEKIEIINHAAMRMLEAFTLRNLNDLKEVGLADLYGKIHELAFKGRVVYETQKGLQLAISATSLNLRGRTVHILSFQNIRSELQEKEVHAWQNLTKVLRHEIMNSIAPIVSLVGTMRNIVTEDLTGYPEIAPSVDDLGEALETIESRGKGIMNFVNAYRDFTALPKPVFGRIRSADLLRQLAALHSDEVVSFEVVRNFEVSADEHQIEMVLLNLVKNSLESIAEKSEGWVRVRADVRNNSPLIEVLDNGEGIVPEALDKIFIPFYTTKKSGSGIGLSLSKQIMQMHGGDLRAFSNVGEGTRFELIFP
ncbi:histidine kinase [Marinilongibacter aquaticus]|nr:histidine kinase [Marinilongibacter aquaticus]